MVRQAHHERPRVAYGIPLVLSLSKDERLPKRRAGMYRPQPSVGHLESRSPTISHMS